MIVFSYQEFDDPGRLRAQGRVKSNNGDVSVGFARQWFMQRMRTILAAGVCALAVGCELPVGIGLEVFRYSTQNLIEAPLSARDDCVERSRNRRLAEEAWKDVQQAAPDQPYTVHYARGFKDGFADFLYAGGSGEPPVVPPRPYQGVAYETPEGQQAVENWFAGFRHGARAAQESGLRNLVVVPVSLRPPSGLGPMQELPPANTDATVPEAAPAPRKLPSPVQDEMTTEPKKP